MKEFFKVHKLFSKFSEEDKKKILRKSKLETIDGDITICKERKDKWYAYVLLGGSVELLRKRSGKQVLVKEGQYFGLDCLLLNDCYYYAVGANATLLRMDATDLLERIKKNDACIKSIEDEMLKHWKIFSVIKEFVNEVKKGAALNKIKLEETLVALYKKLNSSLHEHCNDEILDINAWKYVRRHLYRGIRHGDNYKIMISKRRPADIREYKKEVIKRREIYSKDDTCIAVLKDFDTDLIGFLSVLCGHIVEREKVIAKFGLNSNWTSFVNFLRGSPLQDYTDEQRKRLFKGIESSEESLEADLEKLNTNHYSVDLYDPKDLDPQANDKWRATLIKEVDRMCEDKPDYLNQEYTTVDIFQVLFTLIIVILIGIRRSVYRKCT